MDEKDAQSVHFLPLRQHGFVFVQMTPHEAGIFAVDTFFKMRE